MNGRMVGRINYQKFWEEPEPFFKRVLARRRQHAAAPICAAPEFSDVPSLISRHYRESQHGTRRRQI